MRSCKGHISALEKCFNDSGIHTYNLGTGKGVSVLELINALKQTILNQLQGR